MNRMFGMLSMLLRENLISGNFVRKPEESLVMDEHNQVTAWHDQGADDGPITSIYHLNAMACSSLAPLGGTVVDLGCGSGRYAAYLARLRPDLRIIGFDLSAPMVQIGNASLRANDLAERVELRQGDMTTFSQQLPSETVLINCLFAIHHLPSLHEVELCLTEIRNASEKTGCGFLIFDLVRPRHVRTAVDYPRVFTPDSPEAFRLDSTNSLIAAYSHAELKEVVDRVFGHATVQHILAHILPLYQAFWRMSKRQDKAQLLNFVEENKAKMPLGLRSQYQALRMMLPEFPS